MTTEVVDTDGETFLKKRFAVDKTLCRRSFYLIFYQNVSPSADGETFWEKQNVSPSGVFTKTFCRRAFSRFRPDGKTFLRSTDGETFSGSGPTAQRQEITKVFWPRRHNVSETLCRRGQSTGNLTFWISKRCAVGGGPKNVVPPVAFRPVICGSSRACMKMFCRRRTFCRRTHCMKTFCRRQRRNVSPSPRPQPTSATPQPTTFAPINPT